MSAFKFDIANVYNNLTNIVVRIGPKASKVKAVLVNSHYDSTVGTAGELCMLCSAVHAMHASIC